MRPALRAKRPPALPVPDGEAAASPKSALRAAPLVLVLPMPANVTNPLHGGSRSWRTAHARRRDFFRACDALQAAGRVPAPPARPWPKATLASVMHLGAAMDDDNAMARHKAALDWLVTRGYVLSDRRSCLTWAGLPEQRVKRDGNYRLVLTLTPLED